MSEYDDDGALEALYENDPEGTIQAVIAHTASITAQEIAQRRVAHREQEFQTLYRDQAESAANSVAEAMTAHYGREEIERLSPKIGELLERAPHLIADDVVTSPSKLEESLHAVAALAKQEQDAEDKRNEWSKIMASNSNIPRIFLG